MEKIMNIEKWAPWNWFKHEDEQTAAQRNISKTPASFYAGSPFEEFHKEFDKLIGGFFSNPEGGLAAFSPTVLKPSVDISETGKSYTITAEIPGVEEKDVKLELTGHTLTISGEKKNEREEKDKNWHRIERSYGSFKRVLSLPEDAVAGDVEATFKNGVLSINVPRKVLKKPDNVKQIEIRKAG